LVAGFCVFVAGNVSWVAGYCVLDNEVDPLGDEVKALEDEVATLGNGVDTWEDDVTTLEDEVGPLGNEVNPLVDGRAGSRSGHPVRALAMRGGRGWLAALHENAYL
jgi:hypothetical protein